MKILAVSDLHGNLGGIDPSSSDICIIAGDFAELKGFGKWNIFNQKKWVEKVFIPWVKMFPKVRFVIVPGNHDLFADPKYSIVFPGVNFKVSWPDNVSFLVNSGCEIDGIRFWGSPNVPIIGYRWAFESEHDILKGEFSKIPYGVDVLVTHSPPRIPDVYVDWSLQTGAGPFGSSELTDAIIEKLPKYLFCGHIHSGKHDLIEFHKTKIFNVSRLDENYEIAYEPTIVEL